MIRFLALVGLCIVVLPAWSQPFVQVIAPFPVRDASGQPYTFPFLGGLNAPRAQLVDIDQDGDADLFVQDQPGAMMFFENTGTAIAPTFAWRSGAYAGLDVGSWYTFADLDADGDADLLTEARFGLIRAYRNDGPSTAPAFTRLADTLRTPAGDPIFADALNRPSVVDIDCNGQLDLMLGVTADGTIERYELAGTDSQGRPLFAFLEDRYQDISIISGGGKRTTRHGANAFTFADPDADGDLDLLWGDFFEAGLIYFENTGTCAEPALIEQDGYPPPEALATSGFNAPSFGDLDGDQDLDLLVGVLGGSGLFQADQADNLYFYERQPDGTYARQTRRFLDGIDLGAESLPALADLNGDGRADLVAANTLDPDDISRSHVYLFTHTGTPDAPAFTLTSTDLLGPAGAFNYAPTFGDLDGDGDLDALVGDFSGALTYFPNEGSPSAPAFTVAETRYLGIDVGSYSVPRLADLDADGDLDLLIGASSGTVHHYRNDGTANSPALTLQTEALAGLDVGRRSAPALGDLDRDGDLDLLVGSESDGYAYLRNDGTATTPAFVEAEAGSLPPAPVLAAPLLADLDADGDLDLLVGSATGGLAYHENTAIDVALGLPEKRPQGLVLAVPFPHPVRTRATLSYTLPQAGRVQLTVVDLLGRTLAVPYAGQQAAGTHTVALDASAWPAGVYFIRLQAGAQAAIRPMVHLGE